MQQEHDIITQSGGWIVPVRLEKGCTKLWCYHGFSRKHFCRTFPPSAEPSMTCNIAAAKSDGNRTRL